MAKSPQESDTDATSLERATDHCPYCGIDTATEVGQLTVRISRLETRLAQLEAEQN